MDENRIPRDSAKLLKSAKNAGFRDFRRFRGIAENRQPYKLYMVIKLDEMKIFTKPTTSPTKGLRRKC